MKNICIIGGSGFIGSRLIHRLKRNNSFSLGIIDKTCSPGNNDKIHIGDVRSLDQMDLFISNDSIIIHLAAEHRDDVKPLSLYDEVNVEGARNICSTARRKNVKTIIFTSSVAVYGFAPVYTDETGIIAPFNDYGRTKYEAELIFEEWQAEDPDQRTLVIIRPTVVFGERNRGNFYNLLKQIASQKFVMVGDGKNRKSVAYVENVAAFIEYSLDFNPGVHKFNYVDKPDFTMNELVVLVKDILGKPSKIGIRVPYAFGLFLGKMFDWAAFILRKRFTISAIRVKKFCADSVYNTAISQTGFVPPVPLIKGIERTVRYEFSGQREDDRLYHSE